MDFYKGKIFAGPMVKASCLPFRLECLEYGADGVYGPAISADAILASHRSEKDPRTLYFGTPEDEYVHFRTDPRENGKLVFQILTNDPGKAVKAVSMVYDMIDAIDINCGCPKDFAVGKGAGTELMNSPQTVTEIIKALRSNFDKPISVKHRITHSIDASIQFAVGCEKAGADGIALHGRYKEQHHKGTVELDAMKTVFEHVNCAKLGNGGVKSLEDAKRMMAATKCDSVIISSAALANPSVFSEHPVPPKDAALKFISIARDVCDNSKEWRWTLTSILGKHPEFSKRPAFSNVFKFTTFEQFEEQLNSDTPFAE